MHPETLIAILEQTADPRRAADWDCCGVQIAGTRNPIRRLAVSLDPLESTIRTALDWNADFILTHHPLTLAPRLPGRQDWYRQILKTVLGSDVWLYAAHTSLDVQTRGPASWLARSLELEDVKPVLDTTPVSYWADLSNLKDVPDNMEALSSSQGLRLIQDSQGRNGLCFDQTQRASARALLQELFPERAVPICECTCDASPCGYGVIGTLPAPRPWTDIRQNLARLLHSSGWVSIGTPPAHISCIGYCPGSGMDLAGKAFAQGAQLFLSGDAKYHLAQEIEPLGFTLDVGHFALEEAMMETWAQELSAELAGQGIQVRHISGHNPQRIEQTDDVYF